MESKKRQRSSGWPIFCCGGLELNPYLHVPEMAHSEVETCGIGAQAGVSVPADANLGYRSSHVEPAMAAGSSIQAWTPNTPLPENRTAWRGGET